MSTGIYKIYFDTPGLVYIGQSLCIERRIQAHKRNLLNGTAAKKLQQAYSLYGMPSFSILEICQASELDSKERAYISKYDSVNSGLNTTIGGSSNFGASTSTAYYNKDTYIEILSYLVTTNKSSYEIATELGVSELVVKHISDLSEHSWLHEADPENYGKLLALRSIGRKSCAAARGKTYPTLISPEGKAFQVQNTRRFSEEHGLPNGALCAVLNGKQKYIKGWHLESSPPIPAPSKLISPSGHVVEIPYRGVRKFSKEYGLSASCIGDLISGKSKSHKGWKLFKDTTHKVEA